MTIININQGSSEWLELRRTKITASDAPVIMGMSPWCSRAQLMQRKLSGEEIAVNEYMQRGLDLEPCARDFYNILHDYDVDPCVIVKEWAMASLDGLSKCGKYAVEIKCPGKKDHAIACSGKIPEKYFAQLQHQMYVCELEFMDYFSFDGWQGVAVKVQADENFISKMIAEELKFYEEMQNARVLMSQCCIV